MLCDYAVSAIKAGKNVLVEKPAAIRSADLDILITELKKQRFTLMWDLITDSTLL